MFSHASSLHYNIKAILRHQVVPGLLQGWFLHTSRVQGLRTPAAQISRVPPASSGLGPPSSYWTAPAELTRIVRTCQSKPARDVYPGLGGPAGAESRGSLIAWHRQM